MVMDGGSVVAQQGSAPVPAMVGGAPQQQQQQQPQTQSQQLQQQGQGVQESAPNASRVAREFVRQYYTVMHESPLHLHRFYNEESDFIHGGIDPSCNSETGVRGQQEIHRTILSLNFQDCYAKIRYVDAQESANKSVVVQVAGELSNQGSPMRRFLQTFVLVPLSARKYYVRNDIFRYQDEVYVEDVADEDDLTVNEASTSPSSASQPQQHHHVSNLANGGGDHGHHGHQAPMNGAPEPTVPAAVAVSDKQQQLYPQLHSPPPANDQATSVRKEEATAARVEDTTNTATAGNNSSSTQWESTNAQGQQQVVQQTKQQHQHQQQQPQQQQPSVVSSPGQGAQPLAVSESASSAEPTATVPVSAATTHMPAVSSNNPRSWSQMVQTKTDPAPAVNLAPVSSFGPPVTSANTNQVVSNTFGGPSTQSPAVASTGLPQRPQHSGRQGPGGPRTNGTSGVSTRKDGGRVSPRDDNSLTQKSTLPGGTADSRPYIPDNHQLFVGNIPTTATEEDLIQLFSQFGKVVEFRISSPKSNMTAGMGGSKGSVPHFGFVQFDSAESASKVLEAGPVYFTFKDPSKPPVCLNVEEKKSRPPGNKGGRSVGGVPRSGRPMMSNGGGSGGGGRRDYAGTNRSIRGGPSRGGQTGGHDRQGGPPQQQQH